MVRQLRLFTLETSSTIKAALELLTGNKVIVHGLEQNASFGLALSHLLRDYGGQSAFTSKWVGPNQVFEYALRPDVLTREFPAPAPEEAQEGVSG